MKRRVAESGSVIVETALILPLLFILLFAVFEFGRAYNVYHVLTNAAREGARISVAPAPGTTTLPTTTDVETAVCNFLNSASLPCTVSNNTSLPPCSNSNVTQVDVCVSQNVGETVNGISLVYTQVTVRAPYRFIYFPFGTMTLGSKVLMRNETN